MAAISNKDKLAGKAHDASAAAAAAHKTADATPVGSDDKAGNLRKAAKAHLDAADAHGKAADAQMGDASILKGSAGQDAWDKGMAHRNAQNFHQGQSKDCASQADNA